MGHCPSAEVIRTLTKFVERGGGGGEFLESELRQCEWMGIEESVVDVVMRDVMIQGIVVGKWCWRRAARALQM